MRLVPLLKHEFKNMSFPIMINLFIIYFLILMEIDNEYSEMVINSVSGSTFIFYIYTNCFDMIAAMNIFFMPVMVFLQHYNTKRDFISSLPYTRKELLLSKNLVAYSIMVVKNIIILAGILLMYKKYEPVIENIHFHNYNFVYSELSSVENIVMLVLTNFVLEMALYAVMSFCFSLARNVKLGAVLSVMLYASVLAVDSLPDKLTESYGWNNVIYVSDICEMFAVLAFAFLCIYILFTLLSYRYYMNRKIEISDIVFPYRLTKILFVILLALIMTSLWFVKTPVGVILMFMFSFILGMFITNFAGRQRRRAVK